MFEIWPKPPRKLLFKFKDVVDADVIEGVIPIDLFVIIWDGKLGDDVIDGATDEFIGGGDKVDVKSLD